MAAEEWPPRGVVPEQRRGAQFLSGENNSVDGDLSQRERRPENALAFPLPSWTCLRMILRHLPVSLSLLFTLVTAARAVDAENLQLPRQHVKLGNM